MSIIERAYYVLMSNVSFFFLCVFLCILAVLVVLVVFSGVKAGGKITSWLISMRGKFSS